MSDALPSRRSKPAAVFLLAAALAVALAAGIGLWWVNRGQPATRALDLASPYENTALDVGYVGVEACAKCHPNEHASYSQTPHSRAFRPVDPKDEPLPATYDHEKSGLSYEMYAADGHMRIREFVRLSPDDEAELSDFPVQYVVGSGESSLTYVSEEDGFLLQSPTTWFTKPQHWAMSPGYDMIQHHGFGRAIGRQCLSCHVGRIETRDGSDHKITFQEDAIGCERCHGPGAAHAAFHDAGGKAGQPDYTIVVPTELDRQLSEDICAQCHLDDTMVVERPGIRADAWRPGLPSRQFRIHYGLRTPSALMKVVGHMDQMQASRCYQQSGTMTCLSCHDPHGRPAPEQRDAFYRAKCLTCHTEEACAMDGPHRRAEHPNDSCIACHMPTVDTDIVHFAFTHHRVAIHSDTEAAEEHVPEVVDLVPRDDVSHLSTDEQERNLGMAYMRFAHRPTGDPASPRLPPATFFDAIKKARLHLHAVYARGMRDPHLLVTLAHLATMPPVPEPGRPPGRPDYAEVLRYVDEAFALEALMPTATRLRGLALRGTALLQLGRMPEAVPLFEELTSLRRDSGDWSTLAQAYRQAGDSQKALAALRKAVAIRPGDTQLQRQLSGFYRAAGQNAEADRHWKIADTIEQAQFKTLQAERAEKR